MKNINYRKERFVNTLEEFLKRFKELNDSFTVENDNFEDLELTLGEYTKFILDEDNTALWNLIDTEEPDFKKLTKSVQLESAHSVWAMEKVRAIRYIENNDCVDTYFNNIKNCIDSEFGQFKPNSESKILMFGIGSFPMTALLISKNTKAKVVGIDIDEVALFYAKQIIDKR